MASERGIICTAEEVRGILDGTITELRRVVKPQPEGELASLREWSSGLAEACGDSHPSPDKLAEHSCSLAGKVFPFKSHGRLYSPTCPYGVPGGELYVRETWAHVNATGAPAKEADFVKVKLYRATCAGLGLYKWRSPATMPRWASRIDLMNTSVRVERGKDGWEWVVGIRRDHAE